MFSNVVFVSYPPAEDLVDGGGLLERALGLHHRPHLLHVQHERVQRLLDVRLLDTEQTLGYFTNIGTKRFMPRFNSKMPQSYDF